MNVLAAGAIIFDAVKEKTHTCIGSRKNRTSRGQGQKTIQTQSW
jgi:hypothetical protein